MVELVSGRGESRKMHGGARLSPYRPAIAGVLVETVIAAMTTHIRENWLGAETDLELFLNMLERLRPWTASRVEIVPETKPVLRYWDHVIDTLEDCDPPDLAMVLRGLSGILRWMQYLNYTPENTSREFLDNYAFCELIGPYGLCPCETMSMGLMLLGPDTYYPPHHHLPSECLYLLSGRGTWHLAEGPTISLPPGAVLSIPSGSSHAFWSMDDPMAVIYLCEGAVGENPVLEKPEDAPASREFRREA